MVYNFNIEKFFWSTSQFTVRAESSQTNDAGDTYWNIQSPKLVLPFSEIDIVASSNTPDVDLMNYISIWQTVNLTYSTLVNGASTLKSWMNNTKGIHFHLNH